VSVPHCTCGGAEAMQLRPTVRRGPCFASIRKCNMRRGSAEELARRCRRASSAEPPLAEPPCASRTFMAPLISGCGCIAGHIIPLLGQTPVKTVRRNGRGVAGRTVALLGAIFNYAMRKAFGSTIRCTGWSDSPRVCDSEVVESSR
jgi:hypothetical protein